MNTGIGSCDTAYDFESEENSAKWKGLLTSALKKVLEQVHPSLGARDEALEYVEHLCLRLLAMLCAKPSPHTVQDVESRVQNTFPTPIDRWALKEAQEALERGKKKSVLLLPVDKIHYLLQKELLSYKVDSTVSLFLVAVLEYISADILKLVGNYAKNIKHVEITYQDVQISMKVDKALMDMFYQDEGGGGTLSDRMTEMLVSAAPPRTSLTYEETVRELIASEKAYLKELHMIIKVFREEIKKLTSDPREIELIFSNIMDIYELTYTLSGSLEDVMEMAQEQMPYIGSCFEELAEAAEFDVYVKYAREVTAPTCRETLNNLLARPEMQGALHTAGQGMPLALKYYLPALLVGPIWHFFSYMEYIRLLIGLSPALEDKETLTQVEGLLKPLQIELNRCVPSQSIPRSCATLNQVKTRRSTAIVKIQELERIVENWDSKDLGQCCNEFIREDVLTKVSQKRLTERRVFLFDGLMILCKPITSSRRQSSIHHQTHPECRLKERFFMRKVEIKDHEDTEEMKHAFEILPRQMPSVVLCAKSVEEKNSWMADLVMLNNRSMLERVLDSILSRIEQQHPLKLPPPELYKFAEPDSSDNIVLEQRENGGVPLIKGATLYKLVERLTYHIYADPKFVRTFLTTYRSFCSPTELLELLIERFHIPDASLVYEQDPGDTDKIQKSSQREDWKKYRKEYVQPVQFRVLNVLRHWVDQHFYDFERDPALLKKLQSFLDSINGKSMRKWVNSVIKIVQRKLSPQLETDNQRHKNFAFGERPPPVEWHIHCNEEEYGVLTLHPLEVARQLTVIEFDLYRMIKPSELVGSVWMKKEKEKTSPNLLKMIKHTTNFTRWLEKNIVEAENFEERVAIVNRICEIMIALNEMNNFNGVLAISSAAQSAAVHRLKFTFQAISQQYRKIFDRADDHLKKYQEKLRSINPPCVPFLGMYMTNILHIEEGNPDFLPNTQLINFFKRRKVAEITGEIQQYQNQPYCFKVEPQIRNFLEHLSPFGDLTDTDISNYLYQKSMEIEPRGCRQLPKFPRRWPNLTLKSPGIKVQLGTGQNSPTLSPNSPAAPSNSIINWFNHTRSPSVSSVISTASYRPSRSDNVAASQHPPQRYTHSSQSSTGAPGSPGPHSPASPGPHFPPEPISPRLPPTPPPPPPPLPPRKRRDSPEISSPQQVKQAPDAPMLPPRDNTSPPPLPPRREPAPSPGSSVHHHLGFHSNTLPHPGASHHHYIAPAPRLNPTHTSQLHMRRHAALHPHHSVRTSGDERRESQNGGTGVHLVGSPAKPPTISPRYGSSSESNSGQITPQLPPRPAVRSAGLTYGTKFHYPDTTTT
ncbi:protein son of sevenless isoform X2 [Cylas formicarius]|uniref:protein son of sevenless isoform X2 n=1 Tax=Cylas formicarius TaxID=197179 RepID=UPI00295846FC|nr:protein son of sevenless isoform X2 [Cylas formicarius]